MSNDKTKKTPTQKIFKSLLDESGLSATQFRKKTNIAPGPYSKYNNGLNSISYNKIFEMAENLDVNLKILISKKK